MASRMAASLPGYGAIQWSAAEAVLDSRTSITMSFAPRWRASEMRCACGLK